MRRIGLSIAKILGFLGLWALLTGAVVMAAVGVGGEDFWADRSIRVAVEIALCAATFAAFVFMARVVDKRGFDTLGFAARRIIDLLFGAVLGALILALPIAFLVAMGQARWAPDLSAFSATALGLALVVCFFNVVTQEVLVRGYMFQELWAKYGAWSAALVTTAIFLALHAAPISQGTQGLIAGANILVASLMLSLAYVRTGALWLPIGLHLGWNGFQGPVLGINVTGTDLGLGQWRMFEFTGDAVLTGGAMGVEGGLIGLIGPLAGLAIVAFGFKQQPKPSFAPATR